MKSMQLEFYFDPVFNYSLTKLELNELKSSQDRIRKKMFYEIELLSKEIKKLKEELQILKGAK